MQQLSCMLDCNEREVVVGNEWETERKREYVRDIEMMFILLKTIPCPHLTDTVVMSLSTPSQFSLSETSLWRDGESKCLKVTKMMGREEETQREGGQRTAWVSKAERETRSSLLFSVLSPQPFTPPSPLRVWWRSRCSCSQHCQPHLGEGGKQILHLKEEEQRI